MMKKFRDKFDRTFCDEDKSIIKTLGFEMPSGQYSDGMLTVCSESCHEQISLENWCWLIKSNSKVIAYTAFGDFFIRCFDSKLIYFVNVQDGSKEEVCENFDWFFDTFLIADEIGEFVLKSKMFKKLLNDKNFLDYGECYILEPWLLLGGKDVVENYTTGAFNIYMDLVGQTHKGSSFAEVVSE